MSVSVVPDTKGPVRYPSIKVTLSGKDGNAFFILGSVIKAMRKGGVSAEELRIFQTEATEGDYNHLIGTCMRWVEVL